MTSAAPSNAGSDREPPASHLADLADLADVYCPACGYHLRGVAGPRCPECGYDLAGLRSPLSAIPWVHRRKLGRMRAYWQTVWMVTFQNRRFCEEYARAVDYRDARRFQWLTLLHVALPLLLAVVVVYSAVPPYTGPADWGERFAQAAATGTLPPEPTFFDRAYTEVWPVAILVVSFFLFLAAVTGVPSYFFHPRVIPVQRQNCGIAMSYYTCAPLALTGLLFILGGVACLSKEVAQLLSLLLLAWVVIVALRPWWLKVLSPVTGVILSVVALVFVVALHQFDVAIPEVATPWATVSLALLPISAWWLNLVHLARRTMPQLRRRRAAIAIGVPLLWIILAGVIVIGLPAVILGILIVAASLS